MNSEISGYILLVLSFLIGLTKVYYGRFVDEADTMTIGWLITEGYTLYDDVFSHHFPFPYYWSAMVVAIFGNAFAAVRISILLLQTLLFATGMRISRFYLAIGLTSLTWNLINQYHRGQEAIYATFSGIFTSVIFILVFSLLTNRSKTSRLTLTLLGILTGVALLTDPLLIYAIVISFIALFISGLNFQPGKNHREGFRRVLWVGLAAGLILGIFAITLLITGSADDFYREAILFNSEIYSKYVHAQPFDISKITHNILSGLDILNQQWYQYTSPFFELETYRSVSLENENLYNTWIFSSFFFRLSILGCITGLLLNRKYPAGIFLYFYAAALLVRAEEGIYAIGFVITSLFAGFYLLTELRSPILIKDPPTSSKKVPGMIWSIARFTWIALLLVTGLMLSWLAFRGAYYIASNWFDIANDNHITQYVAFGDDIRQVSCGQEDIELSVFSINPSSTLSPRSRPHPGTPGCIPGSQRSVRSS